MEIKINDLIRQMSLEEKASLCSGADSWHTRAIERLGIPSIRMTDGPHGVRRPTEDDLGNLPSTSYPTATAMAASWDEDMVRRVGAALGEETQSKGCDILLGPAVNIHRAPLCGRNFEYFSEDPYLAGRMAVAYIQGIQSQNTGTSIKHFAANNAEFERTTMSSEVDERALREIYLPAFETAVQEADPWTVMCSYNKINGTWASENQLLLNDILKKEWGFKGLVVSDWGAVHNRIHSSNAGLDLEMPGMGDLPVEILVDAVRTGKVAEAVLDEMVRRILRIVFQARSDGQERKLVRDAGDTPEHRQLAREAAANAVVLLKNDGGVLPLQAGKLKSIAVFGPNANLARIEGGGSAFVNPYYTVTPLEAIRQRAGKSVRVDFLQGCYNHISLPALDSENLKTPGSDSVPGLRMEYYANGDLTGQPVRVDNVDHLELDHRTLPEDVRSLPQLSVRWVGRFTAPVSGEYQFSLSSGGKSRMLVNGQMVVDHWTDPEIEAFYSSWPFRSKYGTVRFEARQEAELVVEYLGSHRVSAGYVLPLPGDNDRRIAELAAKADVALVFVGTTWEHETEGRDRDDWFLPGDQAALVRRVAAANPRTVVILNNGGPIEMASWIKPVAGVLEAWYSGQELGNAVVDVLFGDVNPSGKLPDSLPYFFQENPSYLNFPGENGKLLYGEGIFVGYRYYDAKDIEPLFPFGFGLSYTSFSYTNLRLSTAQIRPGESLSVSIDIRNTGSRAGKEVVQLYVRDLQSRLVRPPKELKGFHKVALQPGEQKTLTFTLKPRDLSYYDPAVHGWVAEPGDFEVLVGASSRDIRAVGRFNLAGEAVPCPRFNAHTSIKTLLADERARAVLQKHIPELVARPELQHVGWMALEHISHAFMEVLPEEKVLEIAAELAEIE